MAAKIKKGDKVRILTGKYRGAEGEVLKVMPSESRVIVRGVNIIKKHQKQTMQDQGGILSREAPIHVSNVALLHDGAPTRVGFRIEKDGRKVRVAKRTGEVVNG